MLTKVLILDASAAAGPEMSEKIDKHKTRVFFTFVSPLPPRIPMRRVHTTLLPVRADQDALVALFASLYCVILGKNIPVMPLVFGQHSGTLAKGTHAPQCLDECRTDKFRPVRNVLDGAEQFVIHFKGNDAVFFVHLLFASHQGSQVYLLGTSTFIINK